MFHFSAPDGERKCFSVGNYTEGHIAPYHSNGKPHHDAIHTSHEVATRKKWIKCPLNKKLHYHVFWQHSLSYVPNNENNQVDAPFEKWRCQLRKFLLQRATSCDVTTTIGKEQSLHYEPIHICPGHLARRIVLTLEAQSLAREFWKAYEDDTETADAFQEQGNAEAFESVDISEP